MKRLLGRDGAILLEVLCAVVIIGVAGLATMRQLREAIDVVRRSADEETRVEAAQRVLTATSLLGRKDLDRRIGQHSVGQLVVDVRRPEGDLYRIAVADQRLPGSELLVTVVYRDDSTR